MFPRYSADDWSPSLGCADLEALAAATTSTMPGATADAHLPRKRGASPVPPRIPVAIPEQVSLADDGVARLNRSLHHPVLFLIVPSDSAPVERRGSLVELTSAPGASEKSVVCAVTRPRQSTGSSRTSVVKKRTSERSSSGLSSNGPLTSMSSNPRVSMTDGVGSVASYVHSIRPAPRNSVARRSGRRADRHRRRGPSPPAAWRNLPLLRRSPGDRR